MKDSDLDKTDSLTRVLDHIAFGSAAQVGNATERTIKPVANLVSGITDALPLPELLPDASKIDNMVDVATISAYSLIAFSITGTIFFTMKTVREFGQWRQWYRFTKSLKLRQNEKVKLNE